MGTYYRIICEEHKEVLDLNRSYDLSTELHNFIYDNNLTHLIYDKEVIKFKEFSVYLRKLISSSNDILLGTSQKEIIKIYLNKHIDCELIFQPDEPYDEKLRKEDGWKWIDIFKGMI